MSRPRPRALTWPDVKDVVERHLIIGSADSLSGERATLQYSPLQERYYVYLGSAVHAHGAMWEVERLLKVYNELVGAE